MGYFSYSDSNPPYLSVRYQPIAEPKDSRYFGKNPGGTTGSGYGELNSARPLNEDWHIR